MPTGLHSPDTGKNKQMRNAVIHLPRRNWKRPTRRTRPGEIPGTVVAHPDALPSTIRVIQYDADRCDESEFSDSDWADGVLEPFTNKHGVTWIDVSGLGNAEVIQELGRQFGLHPLALEDVANTHQRAKVEMYGDHLFFVARAFRQGTNETEQVATFLGNAFVITFQEGGFDCFASVRQRIQASRGRVRVCDADYLLYALLDTIIDGYFPVLEEHGERLDALDDRISTSGERMLIDQIHHTRNALLSVRRAVWPLREAINSLIRDSGDLISDDTDLYLRDCYDHTIQIIDVIETDREMCADLRDFYLTVASNRMNQVMKFLTIIATLFIPLSFIAGLYGMNFNTKASNWNMPELNWTWGYPFALGLMATMATGLIYFFWRRGWLS